MAVSRGLKVEGRGFVSAVFGSCVVRVCSRLSDIDRDRLISSHLITSREGGLVKFGGLGGELTLVT